MAFFADLGRFPEAVILPSRLVGGVYLKTTCYVLHHVRGQQLFHPSVLPRHVDRRSSRLLPHYRVREFVGGGLTARRKRKSLLLRPPLFFLKVGRKKGGRNSGAVRYIFSTSDIIFSCSWSYCCCVIPPFSRGECHLSSCSIYAVRMVSHLHRDRLGVG